MNNHSTEQTNTTHTRLAILLLLVAVIALGGFFWWNNARQAKDSGKLATPVYKKVSADATHDIALLIKSDSSGMYFEWNGIRLSRTSRITGLTPNTQYTFSITNNTLVKEGIFIPALTTSLVINAGQSTVKNVIFSSPGTYYFLGNIYQAGWTGLESGFEVEQ